MLLRRRQANVLLSGLCGILLLLFTSCGTNSAPIVTKPLPDFALSLSPASLSITTASSQNLAVSATASNGFSGTINVSLSGLPSGVTGTPSTFSLTPGTSTSIALTAAANAVVGKVIAVVITGTSGSLSHTDNLALEIDAPAPPPDFTLSFTPQSLTITAGATGQQVALSATAQNGFTGAVNVAVSGLPTGVTASPSTLSLAPGTPQNLTLTAAANAVDRKSDRNHYRHLRHH